VRGALVKQNQKLLAEKTCSAFAQSRAIDPILLVIETLNQSYNWIIPMLLNSWESITPKCGRNL